MLVRNAYIEMQSIKAVSSSVGYENSSAPTHLERNATAGERCCRRPKPAAVVAIVVVAVVSAAMAEAVVVEFSVGFLLSFLPASQSKRAPELNSSINAMYAFRTNTQNQTQRLHMCSLSPSWRILFSAILERLWKRESTDRSIHLSICAGLACGQSKQKLRTKSHTVHIHSVAISEI